MLVILSLMSDPDITLRQAGESSIREVLGKNKMDFIITEGREEVASTTKDLLQSIFCLLYTSPSPRDRG